MMSLMDPTTRFLGGKSSLTEPASVLLPEERTVEKELVPHPAYSKGSGQRTVASASPATPKPYPDTLLQLSDPAGTTHRRPSSPQNRRGGVLRFLMNALDAPALDAVTGVTGHSQIIDAGGTVGANDLVNEGYEHRRRFPRVSTRLTAFLAATTLSSGLFVVCDRSDYFADEVVISAGATPAAIDATTSLSSPITPGSSIHVEVTQPTVTEASTTTTLAETTTSTIVVTTIAKPAPRQSVEVVPTTPTVPRTTPATTAATTPPRAPDTTSPPTTEAARPEFRQMSDNDFARAWINAQPLPGTAYGEKPAIFGDATADQRIRDIAENRGYHLQPVSTTGSLNLQANNAFYDMVAAAKADGVKLWDASDYRSPEKQKDIFQEWVTHYFGHTPSVQEILSGAADGALNEAMEYHAPPGYSYHQTGHVFDLNSVDDSFMNTAGYRWLSAKNWQRARQYGFIPTRPPGTTIKIGSATESWEIGYSDYTI